MPITVALWYHHTTGYNAAMQRNNLDKSHNHNAEQDKPEPKEHMLYNSTYVKVKNKIYGANSQQNY